MSRLCKCGCQVSLAGRREGVEYATEKCKLRYHRAEHKRRHAAFWGRFPGVRRRPRPTPVSAT